MVCNGMLWNDVKIQEMVLNRENLNLQNFPGEHAQDPP